MCNKTSHKHADVIKAWADGATVQVKGYYTDQWKTISDCETPVWHSELEYRVKPEPKPDVITYACIKGMCEHRRPDVICSSNNNWNLDCRPSYTNKANVKFTFDGETGELKKAEVI